MGTVLWGLISVPFVTVHTHTHALLLSDYWLRQSLKSNLQKILRTYEHNLDVVLSFLGQLSPALLNIPSTETIILSTAHSNSFLMTLLDMYDLSTKPNCAAENEGLSLTEGNGQLQHQLLQTLPAWAVWECPHSKAPTSSAQ